jgi:hypothetical protein
MIEGAPDTNLTRPILAMDAYEMVRIDAKTMPGPDARDGNRRIAATGDDGDDLLG